MTYQIITDSCCDLTDAQLQSLQVSCANLTVMYNGESHSNFSEPTAVKAFYDELRGGYGEVIARSIEGREDCPHFRLGEGERCPHLDERGLCRV